MAKDLKAIAAMGAPGFTTGGRGESMNAQQSMAMMKRQMDGVVMSSMSFRILSCKVVGRKATVTERTHMSGTMMDHSGKSHKITATGINRDTWVKLAQGWRVLRMESLKDTATTDGKPVPLGGAAPSRAGKGH